MKKKEIRTHAIFWLIYFMLWGARDMVYHPDFLGNTLMNMIFTLPVAPYIYFNIYYLVPKYLFKKRMGIYFLWLSIGFILVTWIRYHTYQYIFREVFKAPEGAEKFYSWDGYVILGSENIILLLITMALFLVREWYVKEKYTQELERKNMESELKMLKAQLQPHFLFNILNTIYFLMETNTTLAREVMIRFSELLSHQLYNAKKDKVTLKEELVSLENFLKIQQLRQEDFLDLKYTFPDDTKGILIAPMILLTFIENAFKHGQKEEGYFIHILIELNGNIILLHVVNSNYKSEEGKNEGIGLENVKRRLSLIYPERHKLDISKTDETFTVDLTITLKENE